MRLFLLVWIVSLLPACLNTVSTIKEYDKDTGNLIKETTTDESVVYTIEERSLKDKSVVIWSNGIHTKIQAALDPKNSYSPTGEISFTYGAIGWASIHKDQKNVDQIPRILAAASKDVKVDFEGVNMEVPQVDSALSGDKDERK